METETNWKEVDPEDIPLVLEEMAKGGKDSVFGRLNVAFIYSPYKSCSFLTTALSGNDIIKWEKGPMVYFGVQKEFFGRLEHEIISRGLPTAWSYVFDSYCLAADAARKFTIEIPDGFVMKKLDESHATAVNSVWPYATQTSLDLVHDTIDMKETVGLFTEDSSSRLVSWVLHVYYGLGMLYTVKDHRKNGYGTAVVKALSKRIADGGNEVTLLVKEDNREASSVFQNLGFQETGPLQVIQIKG
ncbi:uncharacterized protein LOC124168864 isoform X2 [Ischnura elegans]|uniref:uncharacterized protein LOC124168864 isoform X2 n=1 Tax=Ischnura elegans TaxID=197161 RepID=UPI001ED8BEB7|nr:uncharacterized protein LOC124168864 isoform X2 [Ischnura elegans]